jgi:hypothetical protein
VRVLLEGTVRGPPPGAGGGGHGDGGRLAPRGPLRALRGAGPAPPDAGVLHHVRPRPSTLSTLPLYTVRSTRLGTAGTPWAAASASRRWASATRRRRTSSRETPSLYTVYSQDTARKEAVAHCSTVIGLARLTSPSARSFSVIAWLPERLGTSTSCTFLCVRVACHSCMARHLGKVLHRTRS